VKHTQLTSAVTCEPASCTWSAWETLGAPLPTDQGIAAAAGPGTKKLVAMRRAVSGAVFVKYGVAYEWSPWIELPGITTGATPSVTWHAHDEKFWIAAAQTGTGTIQLTSFDGVSGPQPWAQPGGSGDPPAAVPFSLTVPSPATASWLTPPAIVSDGARLHLYDGAQVSNSQATWWSLFHRIASDDGWGDWRPFRTDALAGWQPAAANVDGEITVLTTWPGQDMWELGSD